MTKLKPTKRYCGCCLRMTIFKYNKTTGHSQCKECGCSWGFHNESNYKAWEIVRAKGNRFIKVS